VPIILTLNCAEHLLLHDIGLQGRVKYLTFLELALLPFLGRYQYLTVSNFGFLISLRNYSLKLTTRFGIYLQGTTKLRKPKVNLIRRLRNQRHNVRRTPKDLLTFLNVIREGRYRSRGLLNTRLLCICSILLSNCALYFHRLSGSNQTTVFKNETKYTAQGRRDDSWIVVCKTALKVYVCNIHFR
jgi:hypothetical protein